MDTELKKLFKKCKNNTKYHLGYPYNLNCDYYKDLVPFLQFFINNLGDSFIKSNYNIDSSNLELEVLKFFAEMWNIEPTSYWGYVTNSGTEGNLLGILYGRETLDNPILVTSKDSHYSIHKASKLFKIPYHAVNADKYGELDYSSLIEDLTEMKKKNDDVSILMVANIGTTVTGAHDKVKIILSILKKCNINKYYIHCDAALSGIFLPLVDTDKTFNFGFDLNIDSISVSGHKFLGTPVPCGVVMTRKEHMESWSSKVEYLNSIDTTINGSRSGFACLCMWYSLMKKDKQGLIDDITKCYQNADYLIDLFKKKNIDAWRNQYSITVVFPKPDINIINKYQLATQTNIAHAVITPSVKKEILEEFVNEFI
jgi:glutamate/tyrosine decarboxylase-like PLP-dependent enzyme